MSTSMIAETLSSSAVAQRLVSLIQSDGLESGDRLPSIRQLSERFNVRPHVVRDALLQVQSLGHVIVRPRARSIVQSVAPRPDRLSFTGVTASAVASHPHQFHLLEARLTLEMELVARAATRRRFEDLLPCRESLDFMHAIHQPERPAEHLEHDLCFHLEIARLAGNPVLTAMLESVLTALRPFLLSREVDEFHARRTKTSHLDIYRALVDGDAVLARKHLKDHLQIAYDRLLLDVKSVPMRGER